MKFFQSVQSQFAMMGIILQQLTQKNPFNRTILLIFFSYTCNIISYCIFMYYEANTFQEYTESFYVTSTDVLVALCYASVVFRVDGFFKFIDACVKLVASSKWNFNENLQIIIECKPMGENQNVPGQKCPGSKVIYDENKQLIEKWSEIIRLAAGKGTPICLILPKSLLSFFLYFATDSGRKSFFLPLPMWWVERITKVFAVLLNTSRFILFWLKGFLSMWIIWLGIAVPSYWNM